ncbi:uncharacterized protein ATC70_000323 [Mucor velutinosus]|uniref:DUF6787 domain-containing protein n=1 Tax=Mucor velutinosus TaxID=708070 RepID=A0AAN7HTY4_9FUNG|nr:hypothetical protein ATC70_000323 [Mucor velutinosus]
MSDREEEQHQCLEETTTLLPTTTHDSTYQGSHRKDWKYYCVWFWRFCIFGVTGSSSVHVTSSVLKLLGCPGGTWYYYVAFFFAELVVYTIMIVAIGTLLLQWRFFCLVAFKMWSWMMPHKLKVWCYEHLHSHRITL